MRSLIVGVCLIVALVAVAYVFLATAVIEDYRWIIIAIALSFLIIREATERLPGMTGRAEAKRRWKLMVEPEEDDQPESDDREEPTDDEPEETDPCLLSGLWTGTVRIWPSRPDDVLKILPLCLLLPRRPTTTTVIPTKTAEDNPRILAANVVEYDSTHGSLDLKIVVAEAGRRRSLEAKLLLRRNNIVSQDDTDPVTVELRRARFTAVAPGDH